MVIISIICTIYFYSLILFQVLQIQLCLIHIIFLLLYVKMVKRNMNALKLKPVKLKIFLSLKKENH